MRIAITNRIHEKMNIDGGELLLLSTRTLSPREIELARGKKIKRLYLPSLSAKETEEFFQEFDLFWDGVVKAFAPDHFFWRNVVSSKMQEWEESAAYFLLVLYTLSRWRLEQHDAVVILLCSSIAEEQVCADWAKKEGWSIVKGAATPRFLSFLGERLRAIWKYVRHVTAFLYFKLLASLYAPYNALPEDARTLIISFLYLKNITGGKYNDPFFGDLHHVLQHKGKAAVYLCGFLDDFKKTICKLGEVRDVKILTPYALISWPKALRIIFALFFRQLSIKQAVFCGCDLSGLLKWNAQRYDYYFNFDSEVFFEAIRKICRIHTFSRMIILFEGNVIERACLQAFREENRGVVVGYSHAVIYPMNLKIHLAPGEVFSRPEPDYLLASGPETKRLMTLIGGRKADEIISACALRHIPRAYKNNAEFGGDSVLIALDGGPFGSSTVLDWILENGDLFQEYEVVIRAHPSVPMNRLLGQCFQDVPEGFSISKDDLESDMRNAFCVLYRQSSVGLQALLNGLPIVHLNIDAPLPCDPMACDSDYRWEVRTSQELSAALRDIVSLSREDKDKVVMSAEKYGHDYFMPPHESNMRGFWEKKV
jgi:hypothetical protein